MKKSLLITDLDGTLACDGRVSQVSRDWMEKLGKLGITRVVATGRSVQGIHRVFAEDFPVDFAIFSSGAGVLAWKGQKLLRSHSLQSQDISKILPELQEHGLGFMLHDPIPENHRFQFISTERSCEDHHRRLARLGDLGRPFGLTHDSATQFVLIIPDKQVEHSLSHLRARLPEYSLIRATSPLDGKSAWVEIFPKSVSKSQAAAWLSNFLNLPRESAIAIGNDFNDVDLLEWAGKSFVVGYGLPHLGKKFPVMRPCHLEGFGEAVAQWHAECISSNG